MSDEDTSDDQAVPADAGAVRHFAEVLRGKGYGQSAELMEALLARAERAEAERDSLKTAAGIDEWCKQFERANRTLNDKVFSLHERLEATEAERDRLREALKKIGEGGWLDTEMEQWARNALREPGHE